MKVWQLDPAQMTPYYNQCVCDAISEAGADVTYFTSQFLYDEEPIILTSFKTETIYFRGLNHKVLLRLPSLRKFLRGLSYPLGHFELYRRMRNEKPDIIHFQWSRFPQVDLRLIRAIRRNRVRVVHTVHDVIPLFAQGVGKEKIAEIYQECDVLIVHSAQNRDDLLDHYPQLKADKIHIVPHISQQKVFPPVPSELAEKRQALIHEIGLDPRSLVILFFGNLKPYKGVDLLIEAFDQLLTRRKDVQLLIVGKADQVSDVPDPARFGEYSHLVQVRTGYVPTSEVWRYFACADIAVFPYRHIYQSGAVITAMGYGLPVIATAVGSLPETIDDNGWLVPPDASAIAHAMDEAARSREKLADMGMRSREIIETKHAPQIVGKMLLRIYRELTEDI